MDRRVTPPKQVISPSWGSPPPRKQVLSQATNPLGQPLQRDVRCVNDLFHSGAAAVYNGSLGTDDGDGNNNVKKSNRFRLAKQLCPRLAHTSLYISLPLLHEYNVQVPNFMFCRGREHKTTFFFFS